MDAKILLSIALGAVLGAWARAYLSLWLNPSLAFINLGTLVANVVGCFIIGLMVCAVKDLQISARVQQLIVTGFLGSLTTFSSYSSEVVQRFYQGAWGQALGIALIHLLLGFLSTGVAIALWRLFKG
ncbi:fluoride efflux transporter CrcB [Psittacicella melopsittaci]|uniref:fluoride efflux transporter CrcB n=1 Tax=Psittacicella melopsittaci TaxID=2028576 RepID=UPI001FE46CC0|nr:fluoride efflux transporter CrcB [Psittacicella melopsittaci]